MDQDKFQRYELAVYVAVGLLATVFLLVGTFVIVKGVLSDFVRSIAAELFGVVGIFFVLRFFLLAPNDEKRDQETKVLLTKANDQAQAIRAITPIVSNTQRQIQNIRNDIDQIKRASILSEQVKIGEKLLEIQKSVAGIDTDINSLTNKISVEIETKYNSLLSIVEERFVSEIDKSRDELRRAVEYELASFIQHKTSQAFTADRLVSLAENAMKVMGGFHANMIQSEFRSAFEDMQKNIAEPVNSLAKEVEELSAQIKNLPLSLPSSTSKK